MSYFRHETAYIDKPCRIRDGTGIWHSCRIMLDVRIGHNCIFGQNCYEAYSLTIGHN